MRYAVATLAALASVSQALIAPRAAANCREVEFTVTGTALDRNDTSPEPDIASALSGLLNALQVAPAILIAGNQTVSGTYCTLTAVNSNNDKLQVLVNGLGLSRSLWSALGGIGTGFEPYRPERYSWVQYANARGYPTLAIDRVGSGESSLPDPFVVSRNPWEEALLADLANQVRMSSAQLERSFQYLIYVGNSYASQLGAGVAGKFPTAFDAFILTGVTNSVQKGFLGQSGIVAAAAAEARPDKYADVGPGYFVGTSEVGISNAIFGDTKQVDFEPIVAQLLYDRQAVAAVGSALSVYLGDFSGAAFRGRVLVLNGENDQAYCGFGSAAIAPAFCGNQPRDTGSWFPNADYNYVTVDRVGHAVPLFERSQVIFDTAHRFLEGQRFQGGTPL